MFEGTLITVVYSFFVLGKMSFSFQVSLTAIRTHIFLAVFKYCSLPDKLSSFKVEFRYVVLFTVQKLPG